MDLWNTVALLAIVAAFIAISIEYNNAKYGPRLPRLRRWARALRAWRLRRKSLRNMKNGKPPF